MYSKKGTLTAAVILMMAAALLRAAEIKKRTRRKFRHRERRMPGRQTEERALEETPPREAKPGTMER